MAWYGSLRLSDVDASNWSNFQKSFLATYGGGGGENSKPAFIDLTDLKQSQDENVSDFYSRVAKVINQSLGNSN
jgi:hypothetical protein